MANDGDGWETPTLMMNMDDVEKGFEPVEVEETVVEEKPISIEIPDTPTAMVVDNEQLVNLERTKDFNFLPIPRRCRYDPVRPPPFTYALNFVFAAASTAAVSNMYYCQPLLVDFTKTFSKSGQAVSLVPTLTQAGFASGLLLIAPLGDLIRRRPLLLILLTCSTLSATAAGFAPNLRALQILSYFLGLSSTTPHVLMPLAGDLAPPHRRATCVAIVLSGIALGVIWGRAVGGVVAAASGTWRTVYWVGAGLQGIMLLSIWALLPDWPSKVELAKLETRGQETPAKKLTYFGVLKSMAVLATTEPILIQGYLIGSANQMIFSSFWVTLTFLLSDPPYYFSTLRIGLFGLIGVLGVCTAPFVGRLIDGLVFWVAVLVAIGLLMISQLVMTAAAGINIGAVIIGCFGLDLGFQMQQVSITAHIFGIDPALRARLNAIYMIAGFIGQVVGSAVGSHVFLSKGWRASSGVCVGFTGIMLLVLLARGPHCPRRTWLGWKGGAKLTKDELKQGETQTHGQHDPVELPGAERSQI